MHSWEEKQSNLKRGFGKFREVFMRIRRSIYRSWKKPARHAIWSHSVTKRANQETGHCSCAYTITYFKFTAVVSGFCWLLTDDRRLQSKVSTRISFLLPDPWSSGCPFPRIMWNSGLGLLLVMLGRACMECMCLYGIDTVSSVLLGKAGTGTRPSSSFWEVYSFNTAAQALYPAFSQVKPVLKACWSVGSAPNSQ